MADEYAFSYGGTDYELEHVIFMYYSDGAGTADWYFREYDLPANGIDHVDESGSPITFYHFLYDSSGNPYYYYFYY